jgi:hypothetical protein
MSLREARILTALTVIGLSGWTVSCGWAIVRFSRASTSAAPHEDRAHAVRPWITVPGVAGAALEASLTDAADPTDIDSVRKRSDELAAILSVRPISSMNWLSLASLRLVTGKPFAEVLGALALSSLTGANEGHVMSQRGIFGLWQWENLPSHARKRALAGLAGAMLERAISDQGRSTVDRILAAKSADTRREIADLLRAEGLSAADLGRIGL